MNGLLRSYFPRRTDLSTHCPENRLAVVDRTQQPAAARAERPGTGRALRDPASGQVSIGVRR